MEFETEEQQIEAIKKWFRDYGMTVIVGLGLGIASIFGFRYMLEQRELNLIETSDAYEIVIAVLDQQQDKEQFITLATTFNTEHQDSIYSNMLSFRLAKLAIETKDFDDAVQYLRHIVDNPQHETIEHIARIRMVRILVSQQQLDEALAVIADAVVDDFRSSYEMLRGDIWFSKGDRSRARQAYAAAKQHAQDGPTNPNLEMLLIELTDATTIADVE